MKHGWVSSSDSLPAEGVVVDTISPNGKEQQLKRVGRLWLLPDGSMYVYYTPVAWLPIPGRSESDD